MSSPIIADFNGDGLTDLFVQSAAASGSAWRLKLSNGIGMAEAANLGTLNNATSVQATDFNDDGFPDLIYPVGGSYYVRLFNPATQNFGAQFSTGIPYQTGDQLFGVDTEGDGHPDLLRVTRSGATTSAYLYRSADATIAGNRIVAIDNGFGFNTAITYKPLTDTSVYTPVSDAFDPVKWPGAPVFDMIPPTHVVASVSTTQPSATTTAGSVNYSARAVTTYRYNGMKLQASGRGSLGFASMTATNNQSGVVSTTVFRQDFPFIGRPASTTQQSSSGVVFSTQQNTWAKVAVTGADSTAYYQVYAAGRSTQEKDPVTGTELRYATDATDNIDSWGNVIATASTLSLSFRWKGHALQPHSG